MVNAMIRVAGWTALLAWGTAAQASHPTWLTNVSGETLHLSGAMGGAGGTEGPQNLMLTQQKDGKAVSSDITKADIAIPNNSTVQIEVKDAPTDRLPMGAWKLTDDQGHSVIGDRYVRYHKYEFNKEPMLTIGPGDGEYQVTVVSSTTGTENFLIITPMAGKSHAPGGPDH